MLVVFEISRPFLLRPKWGGYEQVGMMFMWLFFAIHFIPMRFDEYTILVMEAGASFGEEEVSRLKHEAYARPDRTLG